MPNSSREERRLRVIQRQVDGETPEQKPEAPPVAAKSIRRKRPVVWLFLLLCLVGSTVASFFLFRALSAATPPELVGTWQVMQGQMKGATMQFRPNGTAILSKGVPGDEDNYAVKVENNKIFLSGRDAKTGKNDTFVQTIMKLTEEELVVRDEDRITYQMVRVHR